MKNFIFLGLFSITLIGLGISFITSDKECECQSEETQNLYSQIKDLKETSDPTIQKELAEKLFLMILAQIGLKDYELPKAKKCPKTDLAPKERIVEKVVQKIVEKKIYIDKPENKIAKDLYDFRNKKSRPSLQIYKSKKLDKLWKESFLLLDPYYIWDGEKSFNILFSDRRNDKQTLSIDTKIKRGEKNFSHKTVIEIKSLYSGPKYNHTFSMAPNDLYVNLKTREKAIGFKFNDYLATFNVDNSENIYGFLYKKIRGGKDYKFIAHLKEID